MYNKKNNVHMYDYYTVLEAAIYKKENNFITLITTHNSTHHAHSYTNGSTNHAHINQKAWWKRYVFSLAFKVWREGEALRLAGKEF